MPSFLHEALVQVFHDTPGLLVDLLGQASLAELPRYDKVSAGAESLGEAIPRELRCDTLLHFQQKGRSVLAAVVEVQLEEDGTKAFTWPAYVAGARLRFRCEAILVVVTPSQRVAAWAKRPIGASGAGRLTLQPLVLGPEEVPVVIDADVARAKPELAVVSAIAHGRDESVERSVAIATAAMAAVLSVEGERGLLYYDLIYAALGDAAKKAFDMLPANYEYQHEGLRRARTEGLAAGKAEGLLAVLQARGLAVTAEARARILGSTDGAELDRWLRMAVTVAATENLFGH